MSKLKTKKRKKNSKRKRYTNKTIILFVILIVFLTLFLINYKIVLKFIDAQIINCQYKCESGWSLKGNKCYHEETQSDKEIKAYIVGDIDYSKNIDENDLASLKSYLNDQQTKNNIMSTVYDINKDKVVDINDIEELDKLVAHSDESFEFVCPNKYIQKLNDEKDTTITTSFVLNDDTCNIKVVKRISKPANQFCNDVSTKYDIINR